jgi:hypothetical protein
MYLFDIYRKFLVWQDILQGQWAAKKGRVSDDPALSIPQEGKAV